MGGRQTLGKYSHFQYFRAGAGSGSRSWNNQPYFKPKPRNAESTGSEYTAPDKLAPPDVFKRRLQQQIEDEKMAAPINKEDWPKSGANWSDFNFYELEQHAFRQRLKGEPSRG